MSTPQTAAAPKKEVINEKEVPFYMKKYKIFGSEYPMWLIVLVILIVIAVIYYFTQENPKLFSLRPGTMSTPAPSPAAPAL